MNYNINKKKLLLVILDGWGVSIEQENNAIYHAKTKFYDYICENYLFTTLETSSSFVGLPEGQVGNSEVGHSLIGSGRVVKQDLQKINYDMDKDAFHNNKNLHEFILKVKNSSNNCHLLGLISNGGIHSHIDHIIYFAEMLHYCGIKIFLHLFTDGRDSGMYDSLEFIKQVQEMESKLKNVKLATICGRYYAMDRDRRYDRIKIAYDAIMHKKGIITKNFLTTISEMHSKAITDEFLMPIIADGFDGIGNNDNLFMLNFRPDRARELLEALLSPSFNEFNKKEIKFNAALGMKEYSKEISKYMNYIYEEENIKNTLGEVISKNNLQQLRIAETEKYAHITFFLNGGREEPFIGEDRILIDSPKVKTYDLQPEMSLKKVTDGILQNICEKDYELIVTNFANPDMVGHTGNFEAAVKAVESVDNSLELIVNKALESGYDIIITADHGNIESMKNNDGSSNTCHTLNPAPFIIISKDFTKEKYKLMKNGKLSDISPTILQIMCIEQPIEMTGRNLLIRK